MTTIARTHAPFLLSVAYKDATGQVEAPASAPVWVASNDLVALVVADGGMSAVATLSGVAGSATVTATGDDVTASIDLVIESLPIVSGEITISDIPA